MSENNSCTKLRMLGGLAIIAMIIWNYLANTGELYGINIKSISDKYHNLFTPAGFTFLIWGLIYIGLLGLAVGLLRPRVFHKKPSCFWYRLVVVQSVLNALWIHLFLRDMTGLALLCIVLLLISVLSLMLHVPEEEHFRKWIKATFSVYAGWLSAATIANAAVFLTAIGWSGWGLEPETWYIILCIAAAVIGMVVIRLKGLALFGLALAWALTGIAFAHTDNSGLYYQALIPAFFIFLYALRHLVGMKVQSGKQSN